MDTAAHRTALPGPGRRHELRTREGTLARRAERLRCRQRRRHRRRARVRIEEQLVPASRQAATARAGLRDRVNREILNALADRLSAVEVDELQVIAGWWPTPAAV